MSRTDAGFLLLGLTIVGGMVAAGLGAPPGALAFLLVPVLVALKLIRWYG